MPVQWNAVDTIEPVADSTIEGIANLGSYSTFSGCAQTYSAADMVKTIGAGSVNLNYAAIAVAGNTITLVSDPSNPRWAVTAVNSSGVAVLISGDPAAAPAVPETGDRVEIGLDLVQAGQTIAANITYQIDKRTPAVSFSRYMTATFPAPTTTTYANVATSGSGTASFYADASAVYQAVYWIPLSFGGTGGAKFQFTGPAAPTNVDITGTFGSAGTTDAAAHLFTAVAAFSADINAVASAAAGGGNSAYMNAAPGSFIEIHLRLTNGATAGLVTLQFAQQNANSTSTIGIGFTMTVRRIG